MVGGVDVVEEIPHYRHVSEQSKDNNHADCGSHTVANCNSAQLILGPVTMQNDAQTNHDPRQEGSAEDEHAQETELNVRVTTTPDVDEGAAEDGAEKDYRDEGSEAEQRDGCISEHPGEVGL